MSVGMILSDVKSQHLKRPTVYSTGNVAQCYVAAWMEGTLEENRYMYVDG